MSSGSCARAAAPVHASTSMVARIFPLEPTLIIMHPQITTDVPAVARVTAPRQSFSTLPRRPENHDAFDGLGIPGYSLCASHDEKQRRAYYHCGFNLGLGNRRDHCDLFCDLCA